MATQPEWQPADGGCPCKNIRYRLERPPLIVHCCHCRWCQKESGSAFALNAMIEAKFVTLTSSSQPVAVMTPSESGKGQKMSRCPTCHFVVWSNYGDSGELVRFVRVGTLDDPSIAPPNVHIYTVTKQPWVKLDDSLPIKEEYYVAKEVWPQSSLDRREELIKSLQP